MKGPFLILLISLVVFSCKKENVNLNEERCGTVFGQPLWAKNFKPDSLYSLKEIVAVLYSKRVPPSPHWDTTYNPSIPIKFLPGGFGELNNSVTFRYAIKVAQSMPVILITDIQDLSPVFPFSNLFLNYSDTIKMTVEFYYDKGSQFHLNNEESSLSQIYESSYWNLRR
ncbi:MAG TPA: hypothetical protein VI461_08470 [Chitinophagaceae bacterium]|nr:hypothetical protein [Chitinophagaceae bacterium]